MFSVRLISLVVVGIASVVLALAVYTRDHRNPANRSFAATVVMSVLWLGLAFLSDLPELSQQALLLNRLTLASSAAWGVLMLNFIFLFPGGRNRIGKVSFGFMTTGLIIAAVTATTSLVVEGVTYRGDGTDITPGVGLPVYAAWLIAAVVVLGATPLRKFRRGTGRERAQLKYVMLGTLLFAVPSAVFGIVLPMITGSYATSVLNTYTPLVLFGFTAYAMIKHRLMDMRLVVLRGMAYTVLVAALGVFYLLFAQLVQVGFVERIGLSASAAFVLAGLVAVFLFQPLRSALESLTDRVFYRQRHDQQQLLQRLSTELVGVVDLSEIASAATHALAEQIKTSKIALVREEYDVLAVYGEGVRADDPALPEIMAVASDGQPVLDDELDDDSPVTQMLSERGIQIVAPLLADETDTAVLLLGEKLSGEVYTEQDMRFVQALSTEIAIALKTCEMFEQREQRVRELTALNRLASVLGRDLQLDSLLNRALRQVVSVVAADGGSIMLLNPEDGTLTIRSGYGLPEDVIRDTRLAMGEGIAGWVAEHREPLLLVDGDGEEYRSELDELEVRSALSVPLVTKEHLIGVLNLSRSRLASNFTQQNMSVVSSFAGQLAVAIENAKLYNDLEGHFLGTITALAAAVDAKDPYTYGHSSDVTDIALAVAAELGIDAVQTEVLRKAGILHDIGKIGIDGSILNKPDRLSDEEFRTIQQHPSIGANILGSLEFLGDAVPIVLYHHERYDGKGYPSGLAGEEIPLGARIISVADSYNAMTSDRTYRRAMPREEAIEELRRNAGTQFDARVVDAFIRVVEKSSAEATPVL